jgi:hypothetical protein
MSWSEGYEFWFGIDGGLTDSIYSGSYSILHVSGYGGVYCFRIG